MNTAAIINFNDGLEAYAHHFLFDELETNDPNKEFSFTFRIDSNEEYIIYLFLKINGKNREESFYSNSFEFTDKEVKKTEDKNKYIFMIIVLSLVSFIIIISALFIIIYIKFKKK